MKRIFATDLDGTLIYSEKYDFKADKVLVDEINAYKGYMNKYLYDNLEDFDKDIKFIPLTTRTEKEYKRIHFPFIPTYALVFNGAILLKDNEVDEEWKQETLKLLEDNNIIEDLLHYFELFSKDERVDIVRNRQNYFLLVKTKYSQELRPYLESCIDETRFKVYGKGNKLYIIPKVLEKGNSLKRLKEKLQVDYVISAGDGDIDISMLQEANRVIECEELRESGDYRVE